MWWEYSYQILLQLRLGLRFHHLQILTHQRTLVLVPQAVLHIVVAVLSLPAANIAPQAVVNILQPAIRALQAVHIALQAANSVLLYRLAAYHPVTMTILWESLACQ